MRKLDDKQIHQKGRQDASAWASEMKEETFCRMGNIKEFQDHEHEMYMEKP